VEKDEDVSRLALFEKAIAKLNKDYDGIKLAKSIHKFNVMKQIVLEKRHCKILKLARANLIDDNDYKGNIYSKDWQRFL
jgi:hypothetical protein